MSYRKLNAHPLNSLLRSTFARAAGALGAAAPLAVLANPTGGQVVGGTATIGSAGANGVVITQGSQKAIINWQQFSVGSNEYVQFIQPNSSSVVLNRVIGSNPSNIFGNIIANGQVFLVNANGVYFAPGASIDVQGLVASTLDLNDADFMAGRYVFSKPTGASDAGVVNDAAIHAGPGGYVVLAGDYAQNGGAIVAQTGRVYLAAGNAATLTFDNNGLISYVVDGKTLSRLAGVSNTGEIAANGGLVVMTADVANTLTATAVNNSGLITAHSVSQEGGEIVLEAKGGDIENSGTLDASGLNAGVAGGTIIIHGDGHTQLTDTSVIDAEGDGAKGGFVDLSGHSLGVRGAVRLGTGGNLLIDPSVINIIAGTDNGAAGTGNTNSVGTAFIHNQLNSGNNVEIVASNQIRHVSGTGITATGAGNLTIEIGTVSCPTGICTAGSPTITPGAGSINLSGLPISIAGRLTVHAGSASGYSGNVIVDDVTASLIRITGEKITTGNLTATGAFGAAIVVRATGSSDNGGYIHVNGNVKASDGGVALLEHGGSGINVTGKVTAAGSSSAKISASSSRGAAHVIVGGAITGPEVNIKATGRTSASISVAGVKATKFDVNITASDVSASSHAPAKITVNGNLTAAKNVTLTAVGGSQGGAVITTGAITAYTSGCSILDCNGGSVRISASHGSVDVTGAIKVDASAFNPGGVSINGQKITVSGNVTAAQVALSAHGGTNNGGSLHVTGNVTASTGSVSLQDIGGKGINVVGSISAARDVRITASSAGGFHNSLKTGNITAGDSVTVFYKGGGHDASGGVTVKLGNVDSQRSTSIQASDTSNTPLVVKTGTLTNHKGSANNGQGIQVTLTGADPLFSAAGIVNLAKSGHSCECGAGNINVTLNTTNGSSGKLITTGAIKSTHGNVSLDASNAAIDVGSVSGLNVYMDARTIAFGNVTAASSVNITANNNHHSSGVNIIDAAANTTIKARFINIDMNASYGGNINLANLTASSANHSAGVTVDANSSQGGNHIIVNGNITVNGKGGSSGISSAMPAGGAPVAAYVHMNAAGSGEAAHTVKVGGSITVTGHAGHFSVGHEIPSCGECGTFTASGKGGTGVVQINAQGSHGSVQLLGANTVKGTDAQLRVGATVIKTGAISVTGSGHSYTVSAQSGHFTSHNSFGQAVVDLGSAGGGGATAITTGNISVSGKGSAAVQLAGNTITAGNIAVTATKAKSVRHFTGSANSSAGMDHVGLPSQAVSLFNFQVQGGSFSAGNARVMLAGGQGSIHSSPPPARSVTVGNVSVTGVGQADVQIVGNTVHAGSLAANAAAGKLKGSFNSSAGEAGAFHDKFNINGGEAQVDVQTGSAEGTAITITGGVTVTGPVASVNLFGQTIKVSKGISVTGKGGQATISGSGTGGAGFHSNVKAPGPMTGITLSGVGSTNAASIDVGGVVSAKGPGLIGIAITAAKVTLGGISASASNAAAYKLVNTGDGINDNFTAGSVAVVVFDESGGAITGPAKINGNVTINAPKGNVAFLSQLNVTGQVKITGLNIDTTDSTLISRISDLNSVTGGGGSGGPNISSIGAVVPKINAAGISMTATAGSIDLTGATLTTPTTGALTLKATKDIILSGVTINVGTLSANAGSTIHNGGAIGTITANGLALTAGKNINLSSTQINVGKGSVASLASDPLLLQALAAAGLSPGTPKPNAYFNAGGTLTLGKLTLTGNYMYLQGANITLLGPVSTPAGSVIQLAPTTGPATIGVEGQPGTGSVLNLSNSLLLSLFPGTTLVIGNGAETGAVTLGSAGPFDIGSSNLIIDTTGTVTGLDNVTSTGLISTVESLLASALAPPTPSEIDPNSTNNNNAAGKHHAPGSEDPNAGTTGGTISQSTDAGGACH